MIETQKQSLNKRACISLFVFFSFIILPLSGIPLHFARTDTAGTSVLEHFLMSVHNSSALIFLVAAIIHISLNWNALKKYIATKTNEYLKFRKEMVIALVVIVLIVGLFSSHVFHVP